MIASALRLVDGIDQLVLAPEVVDSSDPIFVVTNQLDMAAPRVVDQPHLGRSGRRDFTSLHDSSVFKAELKVRGDATMSKHEYLDRLRGFLAAHRRPYLYLTRPGWAQERRALLRGDSVVAPITPASGTALEVSIQAEVLSGELEAAEETVTYARSGGAAWGIAVPIALPAELTPGSLGETPQIWVDGNISTPPVLRLYGQGSAPVLGNSTTGKLLSFPELTVPADHFLEIDVENRTVFMDGSPSQSFYNKIDWSVSSWWDLESGLNIVTMAVQGQDSNCQLMISHRARWV